MPLTLATAAEKRQHADTPTIEEIIALASHFIDLYFKGKSPDLSTDLYQKRFIKLVINSSVINAVDLIYDCISIENAGVHLKRKQTIDMVIALYHACAVKGVPKCYATGLILMDYILCKGIDIIDEE